jgi:signal peptidase I
MAKVKRSAESLSSEEIKGEIRRVHHKYRFGEVVRSTIYSLVVVAAIAALVATLWLPVLRTMGDSMTPTLEDGQILISVKTEKMEMGDVIAFYYNNKILIKRVIAGPTDWVEITEDGSVYVNGNLLDEPYILEKAYGDCDITFPYQVPDGRYFVLGDHRSASSDSRHSTVGCVAAEQIVGKLVFRVWPLSGFGKVG